MMTDTSPRVVVAHDSVVMSHGSQRDIYQNLGSQLAAVMLQTGNARRTLHTSPADADAVLILIQDELRKSIRDIRMHARCLACTNTEREYE